MFLSLNVFVCEQTGKVCFFEAIKAVLHACYHEMYFCMCVTGLGTLRFVLKSNEFEKLVLKN